MTGLYLRSSTIDMHGIQPVLLLSFLRYRPLPLLLVSYHPPLRVLLCCPPALYSSAASGASVSSTRRSIAAAFFFAIEKPGQLCWLLVELWWRELST